MKAPAKLDKLEVGLILGFLLPALAFIVTWAIISEVSIGEYINQFKQLGRVSSLISLSTIPNLLLFFIFIWLNKYRAARGVVFATLVLAMIMLIVKFV